MPLLLPPLLGHDERPECLEGLLDLVVEEEVLVALGLGRLQGVLQQPLARLAVQTLLVTLLQFSYAKQQAHVLMLPTQSPLPPSTPAPSCSNVLSKALVSAHRSRKCLVREHEANIGLRMQGISP